MITLAIKNKNLVSSVTATGKIISYTTVDNRECADFTSQSSISISESLIPYSNKAFTITASFKANKTTTSVQSFIKGSKIPFTITLVKATATTFYVKCATTANGQTRACQSDKAFAYGTWHSFELVLLENVFFFSVDGTPVGRRTFSALPTSAAVSTFVIGNGFTGQLESVTLSNTVSTANTTTEENLAAKGYREKDGKKEDLSYDGIDTGSLTNENVTVVSGSNCSYNRYSKGVIFWSPAYKSVWMSTAIFHRYLTVLESAAIGLPMADEAPADTNGSAYCIFDMGAIFKRGTTTYFMPSGILTEWTNSKAEGNELGFPSSDQYQITVESTNVCYMEFADAYIFEFKAASGLDSIVRLSKVAGEAYLKNYSTLGLIDETFDGYTSTTTLLTSVSRVEYTYIKCSKKVCCIQKKTTDNSTTSSSNVTSFNLSHEFFDYFAKTGGLDYQKKFGDYKYPLAPEKTRSDGISYLNCNGGVIVKYKNGNMYDFSLWKLILIRIAAGAINDGAGDNKAELYIETYLTRNGKKIVDGKRWPDYSKRTDGGTAFDIVYEGSVVDAAHPANTNVYYDLNTLQGEDTINLHIRVYDYDKHTSNDYLGSYTINLDITSGWGLVSDVLSSTQRLSYTKNNSGTSATYTQIYLMNTGKDNKNGYKNIKLDLSFKGKQEKVNVDDYFRKYGFWSIDNYKTESKISRTTFNSTFGAQTGDWYDWILHFWDNIWYEIVSDNFSGKEGQCFGLCTEAIRALNKKSAYTLPLNDWTFTKSRKNEHISSESQVESGFAETIRIKHTFQAGWAHINMLINKCVDGKMLIYSGVYKDIEATLKKDKYCLVNLCDGVSSGHTVLAYKCKDNRIYVADCNYPWWDSKASDKDASYISYNNISKPFHLSISNKNYSICYCTPYSIVSKYPRVPSWWDLTKKLFESVFLIGNFAANNLKEFIIFLATSDCEIESSGSTKFKAFDIPMPSTANGSGIGLKLYFAEANENANISIKNKGIATRSVAMISRKKMSTISITEQNKKFDFVLKGIRKGAPKLNLATSTTASSIKIADSTTLKPVQAFNSASIKKEIVTVKKLKFYLNKKTSTKSEIHCEGCSAITSTSQFIGKFTTPLAATKSARSLAANITGCSKCCSEITANLLKRSL
ncbi:Concanavalin A-like lectin/glucanases superfamily protein [Fibrobacter sp. UWH9]|uniref:LamG-like jellyroll fold domain-containing protein n=1 Tax=Fibrobacter sp. UWH9 TaxID=1896213 RepID=UPI00091F626C|nr:LamG-like jellyroll fold domain-containing protein [Fibrobacter sp. UWH9]SHG97891.1 Concanavalin A-like lectin/glucanases superfamily protein [Fibrobacter sp. UWH9]